MTVQDPQPTSTGWGRGTLDLFEGQRLDLVGGTYRLYVEGHGETHVLIRRLSPRTEFVRCDFVCSGPFESSKTPPREGWQVPDLSTNVLYYGDNLDILRRYIPSDAIVTICTHQRHLLLEPHEATLIVQSVWEQLLSRFPRAHAAFVVMPNHVHGILVITPHDVVRAVHELPLPATPAQRRAMLLPMAVGYFKMNSAKRLNLLRQTPGTPVWQRNDYEHVIRTDDDLNHIRQYIVDNPLNWDSDEYSPRVAESDAVFP